MSDKSSWKKVGDWLKTNGGSTVALVGSLASGNVPAAIAAGAAMISGATGTNDPDLALEHLKNNPDAIVKLKEIAHQEEKSIRDHLAEMTKLELEDKQHEHETTQKTIRNADSSNDRFVRWTRPGQSWVSLAAAITYVFQAETVDVMILGALLTLSFTYAGLRQIGKGINAFTAFKGQ